MASNNTLRYSDKELAVFREIIDAKLHHAREQLAQMQTQIIEATQNARDAHGADWMDDSSLHAELEMLNNMAIRQRKYIKELENALIRIKNKVYGVCMISGELIDKRRLMAVPTTTKSVEVKNAISSGLRSGRRNTRLSSKKGSKIISKIKSKPKPKINKPTILLDGEEDLLSSIEPPPAVEEIPLDQIPNPEELD